MAAVAIHRSTRIPSRFPPGYDPLADTTQKLIGIWKEGHMFFPPGERDKVLEERLKKIVQNTPLNWANYVLVFIDVAGVVYVVIDVCRKVAKL